MPKKGKLKGVTFQLVHRSQQDPLIADDTAPQRVLLPITGKDPKAEKEKRIEEQHKYGIYYDDDCNYLEHLKDSKDNRLEWPENVEEELRKREQEKAKPKIKLPASVFASEVEEKVGMLGKAAPISGPRLDLDPDIVAAMDEDFDYDDPDNQLEDNFMELANGVASDEEFDENDEDNYIDSDFEDEDMDDYGSDDLKSFKKEETKSRLTTYSMTSSVIRRNDQLRLLDDRFDKMLEQYDETEIGALDAEEIEGHIPESSDILLQLADQFEKDKQRSQIEHDSDNSLKKKTLDAADNESDEENFQYVEVEVKDQYDCQSILSTYSNIYNHPKVIPAPPGKKKIKINRRTGIPENVFDSNKLTIKALNQLGQENGEFEDRGPKSCAGQSVISQLSALSIRPKNETQEEKRERKRALKEYRKERRLEKKANSEAFKEEAKRQQKIAINNRNNIQGNKIL